MHGQRPITQFSGSVTAQCHRRHGNPTLFPFYLPIIGDKQQVGAQPSDTARDGVHVVGLNDIAAVMQEWDAIVVTADRRSC